MKKNYFFIFFLIFSFSFANLLSQTTTIPDANFEQALIDLGIDSDGTINQIVLTSDAEGVTSLNISNKNISDLTGINEFSNLIELRCSDNELRSLDVYKIYTLQTLYCDRNKLSRLHIKYNENLKILNCDYNLITDLDVSDLLNLTYLSCHFNRLRTLNVKNENNSLITYFNAKINPLLDCIMVDNEDAANSGEWPYEDWHKDFQVIYSEDCLTIPERTYIPDVNFEQALIDLGIDTDGTINQSVLTADLSAVTSLNIINKGISDLTGIRDFSSLTQLYCSSNQLTSLNVVGILSLHTLYCHKNQLASLDLDQNSNLKILSCFENNLSNLDVSSFANLTYLSCDSNQLTILDLSQNGQLEELYCDSNQLTILNVKNGNNPLIKQFNATNNPLLSCIEVDDENSANIGEEPYADWEKDSTTTYSEDCLEGVEKTYIPDDAFEHYLIYMGYDDIMDDYVLTKNIINIESLGFCEALYCTPFYDPPNGILDLTGIEDFISLKSFSSAFHPFPNVDFSNNKKLEFVGITSDDLININLNNNEMLKTISLGGRPPLEVLNLSNNPNLEVVHIDLYNLVELNLKNGNNTLITGFDVVGRPNLTCVQVDDKIWSDNNWGTYEQGYVFSEDCQSFLEDQDNDGVSNDLDICPNTPEGEEVDANGCSDSQKDIDGDGVMDDKDTCSDTSVGEIVDINGCSDSQKDSDEDGVMDDKDTCSGTPSGEIVDINGCSDTQLSVYDVQLAKAIKYYPNPVSNVLTIDSKISLKRVEIYSILGQKIMVLNSDLQSIQLNNLSGGIYLIKLYSEKGSIIRKLIKK